MDQSSRLRERERLADLITEWNANRLELFEISMPDENLEFHGVMRFFFQDEGSKVATKCIRVSSMETTTDVVETLVEKFRPDMKMLTQPTYYLYELNANGDERVLKPTEHPLLVQLNWSKDDREGRFLLRNANAAPTKLADLDAHDDAQNFKRKLSKREKKEQKKKGSGGGSKENDSPTKKDDDETTSVFTRTKSNSEAVMRRRRQMKLENKFMEIKQQGDEGGLLKVYGETLNPDVPYKSLLLSVTDSAAYVVREMLDKYGLLTQEDPDEYCLVQVFNAHAGEIGGGLRPQEHLVENDECPLAILQNQVSKGNITFHVRRRDGRRDYRDEKMPHLLELNLDGSDMKKPKKHLLHLNITEVGSIASPSTGQHLRLIGPTILPHHAVIAHISGVVTVTPTSREAETYVEGQRIYDTTVIQHGKIVRFGHHHAFRFVDPKVEERSRKGGDRIEDYRAGVGGPALPLPSENGPPAYTPRLDDVLPAGLEFRDEGEENFLHSIVSEVTEGLCQFKLAPAYAVYLATRYRVDRRRPGAPQEEHLSRVQAFAAKVAYFARDAAARCRDSPQDLAFWMANASEMLHFFKQDIDIGPNSGEAQDVLADAVQDIFRDLVYIMQTDLNGYMPSFLVDSDDDDAGNVLHVLSSAMSLLRRCRVNAALTIQLFSQLFHFVNMWLFNKLVMEPHLRLMTRQWGARIKRRLGKIEAWAEKQGLELAADCHLCRISQAAHLLQSSKWSREDVPSIGSACFKLNSLQMRALLTGYIPQAGEPRVPPELIESVVAVAASTADEQTRTEGREVRLEEDVELLLPFLLPEDGYSCDVVKDVPPGLQEFLQPLVADGLCRLTPLPSQSGAWTVFMPDHENNQRMSDEGTLASNGPPGDPAGQAPPDGSGTLPHIQVPQLEELPKPEILSIMLNKVNGSMGLSIVAAKGENQPEKGIYIRSVVPGGAAALDGRLQAGDQLLQVDGRSLVGLSQELAAEYMKDTKQTVNLLVAKQSAVYHGLATFLNQPSPIMPARGKMPAGPADMGKGGADGRLKMAPFQQPLQSSKSTPMLSVNSGYGDQAPRQPALGGDGVDLHSRSTMNLRPGQDQGSGGAAMAAGGAAGAPRSQMVPAPPGPFGGYDPTSRATSHPELPRGDGMTNPYADQPNYQNYPGVPSGPDYRDRVQQQPGQPSALEQQQGGGVIMRHPSASGPDARGIAGGMRPGSQYDFKGPGVGSQQQQQQFRSDVPQRPRSEFVDPSWWQQDHDDGGSGPRAGGQPIYQNQSSVVDPRQGRGGQAEAQQQRPQLPIKPSSDSFGASQSTSRFDPMKKVSSGSMPDDQDLPPPPQSLMQPQYNYENQNRYDDSRPPQARQEAPPPAPWATQPSTKQPFGQQQPRAPEAGSAAGRPYDGMGASAQFGGLARDPGRPGPSVPDGFAGAAINSHGGRAQQQQPASPGYSGRGPPSPGYQQQGPGASRPFGGWPTSAQGAGPQQQQGPPQSPPFAYGRPGMQPDSASARSATLPPPSSTVPNQQRPAQVAAAAAAAAAAPAWQREEEERGARQFADEGSRRRDELIAELQSRPRRTAEEEEKLRRLMVDQEFERRAQEASHRKDTSASDDDRMPGQNRLNATLPSRVDGFAGRQEPGPKWGPSGAPGALGREPQFRGAADFRGDMPPVTSGQPPALLHEPASAPPTAVKLETIPSKTIVFKPAYRAEPPAKLEADKPVTFKPAVKPPGNPTSPSLQLRSQASGSQLARDQPRLDARGGSAMQPLSASQLPRPGPQDDARRQQEAREKQRRDDEDRRRSAMMQPPPPVDDDMQGRWRPPQQQQDAVGTQPRRDVQEREPPRQQQFAPGGGPPQAAASGPSDRRDFDGQTNAGRSNGPLPRPGGPGLPYNPAAAAAPAPPDRSSSFQAQQQQRYGSSSAGYIGAAAPQPYGGAGVGGLLMGPQPYGGGGTLPSSQPPYGGAPPAAQQPPYTAGGAGPGGPAATQSYGGVAAAQAPYGNGPAGQAPYGGGGSSAQQQPSGGVPYDQRYAGGGPYDRRSGGGAADADPRSGFPGGSATAQLDMSRGGVDMGAQKKSVSFNSNLETEIPVYQRDDAVGGGSNNYQNFAGPPPSAGYGGGGAGGAPQPGRYGDFEQRAAASYAMDVQARTPDRDLSGGSMSPPHSLPTPGVIGTQEVYRDPRARIEAQKRSQMGAKPEPQQPVDRLSFRDKMKFFATTAGENTPQERPRSSKTQRMLEDHLMYGSEN